MNKLVCLILSVFLSLNLFAQKSIEGKWKTIDDETGKTKSIVEISIKNGKLYGKVLSLNNDVDENKTCTECTDYRKGERIIGMEIITGLEKEGDAWEADDGILDPENGKIYDCKIWLENNKLQVRGYIGFLFRTQTWVRT